MQHRIAEGDQDAFTHFFYQYKDKLFHVSKLYVKNDTLAEEAVQEIFMRVWVNREKLKEVQNLESWLFIVARNYLIRYMEQWARTKATENSRELQLLQQPDDEAATYEYYQQVLESAIATLAPQQQAVFRLAKQEQLSYREIADRLSLSPFTVKTHMQRALNQIRDYLRNHPEVPLVLLIAFHERFMN